jgi:hypothetical protein
MITDINIISDIQKGRFIIKWKCNGTDNIIDSIIYSQAYEIIDKLIEAQIGNKQTPKQIIKYVKK